MTDKELSLARVQAVSWAVLAVMTLGAAVLDSLWFAWSVLAGGLLSIGSFWLSGKDVLRVIGSIVPLGSVEERQAQARQSQKGYILKFWLRIVIIGVVLLLLIKGRLVNIFGMILGLSTVVLAVTFISLDVARRYFFRGRR